MVRVKIMAMKQSRSGNRGRRGRFAAAALLCFVVWTLWPVGVWGWGQTGHRVVGRIAESRLTERAALAVDRILQGQSLAEVANWSDEIRSEPAWDCAAPFHYVTVREGATYPESGVPPGGDAIGAALYYAEILADPAAGPESQSRALRFLVHLVGDLSQPLHAGKGCDAGGNQIRLLWFGEETNLHSVWDDRMLEAQDLSFTEMVDFIDHGQDDPGPEHLDPLAWIGEAQSLFPAIYRCFKADGCACFCGGCEDGTSSFGGCAAPQSCALQVGGAVRLSWAYRRRQQETVDRQLLQGGLRLASWLNAIFDENVQPPESLRTLRERFDSTGDWRAPYRACSPTD